MTQVELSRKSGISQSNVSQYERFVEPTAGAIAKLADALNTTADYLVGRSQNPEPPRPLSDEHLRLLAAFDRGDVEMVGRIVAERLKHYLSH